MTYTDFDVLIDPDPLGDSSFQARVLGSPEGESKFTPLDDAALKEAGLHQDALREAIKRGTPAEAHKTSRALGTALFNALFPDENQGNGQATNRSKNRRELLHESLRRIQANPELGLRIKLRIPPHPDLSTLPWELLYEPQRRSFLNQQKATPVVRHLSTSHPAAPRPFEAPLRILVVMANPQGTFPLDLAREKCIIEQNVANQPGIEVVFLEGKQANKKAIEAELNRTTPNGQPYYHVFHFMGHGTFNEREGGVLKLDDGNGRIHRVGEDELGALLGIQADTEGQGTHSVLSLIFLNACETATTDEQTRRGAQRGTRGSERTPTTRPSIPPPPRTPWQHGPPWTPMPVETLWQQAAPWAPTATTTQPIASSCPTSSTVRRPSWQGRSRVF